MLDLQLLFPLTFLGMKHILQERYDVTRQRRRRRHLAYQCCICRVRLRKSTTSEPPTRSSLRTIFAATASTLRLPFPLLYQRKKERERGKMGPSLIIGSPFFYIKTHWAPNNIKEKRPNVLHCCQKCVRVKRILVTNVFSTIIQPYVL